MPASPSLFGIPFEVRAMIIQQVILAPRLSPAKNLDELAQQQRQHQLNDKSCRNYVSFLSKPATNPAMSLLLTNSQLYDETLDTLQHTFKGTAASPSYTADIIYLNNGTLWPTWLSTPVRASHVDTVHIQFRVFHHPEELRPGGVPRYRLFNPGRVMWSCHDLLLDFLLSGRHGPCGQPITVNRLVLDFLPATDATHDIFPLCPSTNWEWLSDPKELGEWISTKEIRENVRECFRPPHWMEEALYRDDIGMKVAAGFMGYVWRLLEWIAGPDHYYLYAKTEALYEHVGVVEIRLDGKPHKTVDLASYLEGSPPDFGGDTTRADRYWGWYHGSAEWRREVKMKRRKLGMPVYE